MTGVSTGPQIHFRAFVESIKSFFAKGVGFEDHLSNLFSNDLVGIVFFLLGGEEAWVFVSFWMTVSVICVNLISLSFIQNEFFYWNSSLETDEQSNQVGLGLYSKKSLSFSNLPFLHSCSL